MKLTSQDVVAYDLQDLTTHFTDDQIQVQVDAALALIDDTYPGAANRLSSGAISKTTYTRIVSDMVLRVLRRAYSGGHKTESDGSYSYGDDSLASSTDLWIPDKDAALLTGDDDGLPGTVFTGPQRGWGL